MGKFAVGDVLRVRDFEDMASEFGETNGEIIHSPNFARGMRPLCGQLFTVRSIRGDSIFAQEPQFKSWSWAEWMLEFADDDRETAYEVGSFADLFGGVSV